MRLVIALGGNALLRRGEPLDVETQRANVKLAMATLAPLVGDHELVITHGNGPQIGLLALQAAAFSEVAAYPLDVLGAESEGMIGYLLEQALATELPDVEVATLLTQVVVDISDPAFRRPTEPIGPLYDETTARHLAAARGWLLDRDGPGWRRVVASPEPLRILEAATIARLVDAGVVVVCTGGGGIPVVVDAVGAVRGVEAVVDKDRAAAMLAAHLHADSLLLLTDTDAVYTDWGTDIARPLSNGGVAAMRALPLPPGTMGPKVEAACRFTETTGYPSFIGALINAAAVLDGKAGTRVSMASTGLRYRT